MREDKVVIAWFSAGVTSAVACKLALDMYENVQIYYIETGAGHQDNKRFIKECEAWYGQKINIIQNSKGYKDHVHVVTRERYVNGVAGARCTVELKKNVRYELEKKIRYSHQVFGFEYSQKEINRSIRFKEQHSYTNPLFPLIKQKLTKNQCAWVLDQVGIELPTMYKLGYENNNCIGCVKGGSFYWNKIKKDFPDWFNRMAEAEREVDHSCIKNVFLDELDPNAGRENEKVMPECGIFCQVELADLVSEKTEKIMNGELDIDDV
jgi:hypothetical protein